MKSLFKDDTSWSTEAIDCDRTILQALRPVFKEFIAKGFSPREIAHIAVGTAISLECEEVIDIKKTKRSAPDGNEGKL